MNIPLETKALLAFCAQSVASWLNSMAAACACTAAKIGILYRTM